MRVCATVRTYAGVVRRVRACVAMRLRFQIPYLHSIMAISVVTLFQGGKGVPPQPLLLSFPSGYEVRLLAFRSLAFRCEILLFVGRYAGASNIRTETDRVVHPKGAFAPLRCTHALRCSSSVFCHGRGPIARASDLLQCSNS